MNHSTLSAADGTRAPGFTSLFTPAGYNPKADKGEALNYLSTVLYLAPSTLSGRNVCLYASDGCIAGCLNTAGRGGFDPEIQPARRARTDFLFTDHDGFFAQAIREIEAHVRKAARKGMTPCVRLNGTSDLPWERMPFTYAGVRWASLLAYFPDVQFYDYTKNPGRAITNALGAHPANYHVTFSRSERNEQQCRDVLAAGGSVAVVFATHAFPATFYGRPVVDGDAHDLRFVDPRGVVVGLKAKGKARRDTSGFVVHAESVEAPQLLARAA
jgi:hypothetical protein